MLLSSIRIPCAFASSSPAEWKLKRCRDFYRDHGHLDRELVVNSSGFLIDGYIGYLVLMEAGVTEVKTTCMCTPRHKDLCYIGAVHTPKEGQKPNNKTYFWRVTTGTRNADALEVGKLVRVRTRHGAQTARVVNVLSAKPEGIKKMKTAISILTTDTEERNG